MKKKKTNIDITLQMYSTLVKLGIVTDIADPFIIAIKESMHRVMQNYGAPLMMMVDPSTFNGLKAMLDNEN